MGKDVDNMGASDKRLRFVAGDMKHPRFLPSTRPQLYTAPITPTHLNKRGFMLIHRIHSAYDEDKYFDINGRSQRSQLCTSP